MRVFTRLVGTWRAYVPPAPRPLVYWMERPASAVPSPRNDCRIGGTRAVAKIACAYRTTRAPACIIAVVSPCTNVRDVAQEKVTLPRYVGAVKDFIYCGKKKKSTNKKTLSDRCDKRGIDLFKFFLHIWSLSSPISRTDRLTENNRCCRLLETWIQTGILRDGQWNRIRICVCAVDFKKGFRFLKMKKFERRRHPRD